MTLAAWFGGVLVLMMLALIGYFSGRERKAEKDLIWRSAALSL